MVPTWFGVSNNLHLSELLAILRDPRPQRFTSFGAIQNPTAFAIVQIEASNVIYGMKRWCQRSHQSPKRWGSHSEVVSVSTLGRLQEVQVVKVPWDNSLLEPSEDRVKSHRKKGNHSLDNLVVHLWPWGIVLGLLRRIPRAWCCRCKYFAESDRERRAIQCSRAQRRSRSGWRWDRQQPSQSKGYLILAERTRRGPEWWSQSQRCCQVRLSWEDASLWWMYASHGVPVEAWTDGRSKKFAMAIA